MYDMGEYYRTGINNNRNKDNVQHDLNIANKQRYETFISGEPIYGPGQNDAVFVEATESNAYYQTKRGKVATNDRRSTPASYAKFLNFYPFEGIEYISPRPILFIAGSKAPTFSYTKKAYDKALEPKELYVVEGANRVELYDRVDLIPFEKIASFFDNNL